MWCGLLATLLLLLDGSTVTEQVEYYEIKGSAEQDLRSAMNRLGPRADDGKRHDSYTKWYVRWEFEYESRDKCVVTAVRTALVLTTILPKWTEASSAPDSLVLRWDRFIRALELHEKGHARIGVEAAEAIQKRLLELPPSPECKSLETSLNEAAEDVLKAFRQKNTGYDLRTVHGLTEGAVFP